MQEISSGDAFWDSGSIGTNRLEEKGDLKGLLTNSRADMLEVGMIRKWVEQEVEVKTV